MELEPGPCPVALTLSVIGGKWKPTLLYHLKDEARRFNELRRLVPDITQRMLTMQLRALEEDGVVLRMIHDTVPPQVEYELTPYGRTLGPIIEAMERWGERHAGTPAGGSLRPGGPLARRALAREPRPNKAEALPRPGRSPGARERGRRGG